MSSGRWLLCDIDILFYCDITTTYSVFVEYIHATVDLILMAVDQKDIQHWKEPAVHSYILKHIALTIKFIFHNYNIIALCLHVIHISILAICMLILSVVQLTARMQSNISCMLS